MYSIRAAVVVVNGNNIRNKAIIGNGMDMTPGIYFPLDEARAELAHRRQDSELCTAVEAELGDLIWPECREKPVAYISQQLLTPGNGFVFFCQASRYVGCIPFAGEFLEDSFSYKNDEKSGLGRLRAVDGDRKMLIDIIRLRQSAPTRLCEIVTRAGEPLTAFHHRLLDISGYHVARRDMSGWYRSIGGPSNYYYPYLLHFITHGVLFENFQTDSDEGAQSAGAMSGSRFVPLRDTGIWSKYPTARHCRV